MPLFRCTFVVLSLIKINSAKNTQFSLPVMLLKASSHIACHAHALPVMLCVNSHMPCRAPALLQQCRVLHESPRGSWKYPNCWSNSLTDHLFCSVLLPLFTVVGMDRCEGDWYASDNNLHGTPRGSQKKPNAGR